MKVNLSWWVVCVAFAASCGTETTKTAACGAGDEVVVDAEAYCVYQQSVVVENGFECPPDKPTLIEEGAIGICTGRETVPGGLLERIGMGYREQNPEFENCILDFECSDGEVCRVGGCTPAGNNVTTNNVTTNNVTSTNNGTNSATNNTGVCTVSADCGSGQDCVNGACANLCGGFAGLICEANEWCDYADGAMCGAADQLGECRLRPENCTQNFDPVCGCDGADYGNACTAQAAGVDVAGAGTCL